MAEIPVYQQTTSLQAPTTGIYISNGNSAFLDSLSSWAFQLADKTAEEAGKAQGVKDQQESGSADNFTAPDGILGGLSRLTSYGRGRDAGAAMVFSGQKQARLTERVAELQKKFPGDPDGFRAAYDNEKKTWLKDVPANLLPNFASHADEVGNRNYAALQNQKVQLQRETQAVSALGEIEKLRTEAYDGRLNGTLSADQVNEKLTQANTILRGATEAGYITPMQAKAQVDQMSFNIKTAEILADFRKNPSMNFVEAIKNAKETTQYGGGTPFTPEQRQMLGSKLDSELNQLMSRARAAEASNAAQIKAKFDDHIAQVTTTGEGILSDDEIKTAFAKNPQIRDEALARSNIARETFSFNQSIGLTSAAEDQARLAKLMPHPGETAYATKLQAYGRAQSLLANKWQQVESDPAQYVLANSPEIRTMVQSEDPAIRTLGYAAMRQLQTNMGVSPGAQMVLPNSGAKALVQEIQSAAPEAAADRIASIAAQYGENYPAVAKQFAKLQLNPAYQVLASMTRPEDAQARVDLAKALSMGNDLKDNLDKRDSTVVRSIDQNTQTALADFTRSAMAQGDPKLVKTVNDAATFLAYYYASQPGTDATTAARKAVTALTDRYQFVGDMRVPKGLGADVESATADVRKAITPDILRPVPARPGETLTEEQRLGIQADQARRGRWVTNEDGSGVVLLYPNGQPVMVKSNTDIASIPAPTPPQNPNIDPTVANKAMTKKGNTSGSELNAEKVEAAKQQVQDRKVGSGDWRRVEVYFKDAKRLAPVVLPPTPTFDGVIQ